jgi:hypothetical protein
MPFAGTGGLTLGKSDSRTSGIAESGLGRFPRLSGSWREHPAIIDSRNPPPILIYVWSQAPGQSCGGVLGRCDNFATPLFHPESVNLEWPKSQEITISMAEHSIDRKKVRRDLEIARTKLFEQFLKHPQDARLALAVKLIDDQIASCSEWIRTKEKGAEKELQKFLH